MPTQLPNGLLICNLTPHDLHFWCNQDMKVVTAPSDGVLNANTKNTTVCENEKFTLTTVHFEEIRGGRRLIEQVKSTYPDALIVGSIIAANAYRGDVVASVPEQSKRYNKGVRLVRSDRFTIFEREQQDGEENDN